MDATDDPNGFGVWLTRHRRSLNKYAREHGGSSEDVAKATERFLADTNEAFPWNNDALWRHRYERAITLAIFNRRRGEERAEVARQEAGRLYSDGRAVQHCWPHPLGEVFVCPAGHCKKCGFVLTLRLERETPDDDWIEVFGCTNGHRQYREVQS